MLLLRVCRYYPEADIVYASVTSVPHYYILSKKKKKVTISFSKMILCRILVFILEALFLKGSCKSLYEMWLLLCVLTIWMTSRYFYYHMFFQFFVEVTFYTFSEMFFSHSNSGNSFSSQPVRGCVLSVKAWRARTGKLQNNITCGINTSGWHPLKIFGDWLSLPMLHK